MHNLVTVTYDDPASAQDVVRRLTQCSYGSEVSITARGRSVVVEVQNPLASAILSGVDRLIMVIHKAASSLGRGRAMPTSAKA